MCTDTETLNQVSEIENYLNTIHPRITVERGKGSHELIIYEPQPEEGKICTMNILD